MNFPPPEEGDIRMRLDPYDELERDNIRAGVFEVDSSRLGTMGEDFLRKVGDIGCSAKITPTMDVGS